MISTVLSLPESLQKNPDVTIPKNGDRIEVYGAWVTDRPHEWNEIHPSWNIIVVK